MNNSAFSIYSTFVMEDIQQLVWWEENSFASLRPQIPFSLCLGLFSVVYRRARCMPAAVYSRRDGDGVKREKEMMRNERVKKK